MHYVLLFNWKRVGYLNLPGNPHKLFFFFLNIQLVPSTSLKGEEFRGRSDYFAKDLNHSSLSTNQGAFKLSKYGISLIIDS